MFKDFYTQAAELHEAIKRIRNVWIPFTPTWQGHTPLKGEYMVTDDNIIRIRMKSL